MIDDTFLTQYLISCLNYEFDSFLEKNVKKNIKNDWACNGAWKNLAKIKIRKWKTRSRKWKKLLARISKLE